MDILVLTQYYWPESFRINDVVNALIRAGCRVTVLTGQPNYPEGRVYSGYKAWHFAKERHPGGYDIFRVAVIPRGDASAVRLGLNYLSFVVTAATVGRILLRGRRFDVVFVYGISPILQAIPGIVLKRSFGAKLVTWVQDLWPESLEATGYVRRRWQLEVIRRIVRWIYERSDLLLIQSRAFRESVRTLAGNVPIAYHPNPGSSDGTTAKALRPVVTLDAPFSVVFAGNLGTVQALGTIIEAADMLQGDAGIQIVIVGSGSRSDWLTYEVGTRKLTNVRILGRVLSRDMPAVYSQAAALLVTLARDRLMRLTVPSKIQDYLAAGRPIIGCLDGEGARILEEAKAGLVCPAEDATALAEAIRRLRSMPSGELENMGRDGRAYYMANFHPTALAEGLIEQFRKLLSEHP